MTADEPDLFDVLEEIEHGPLPCPHLVHMGNGGWAHQRDPNKPYYLEWVHANPRCMRSKFPGKYKTPMPTTGWSRELQKDVPLCQPDEPSSAPKSKPTSKKSGTKRLMKR